MKISRAFIATTALVSYSLAARTTDLDRENNCPATRLVDTWNKAIACGNNGCTELVTAFGKPATVKVTWNAANAAHESKVLTALSNLGETASGCKFGEVSVEGMPCVLTPNVLKVYSSSDCYGSDDTLPLEAITQMTSVAKRLGKTLPNLSASTKSGFTLMEFIHATVQSYPGIARSANFARAVLLQLLFAYHVAFRKVGFVHRDVLGDNIALRCETTFKNGRCSPPTKGSMIYCYRFDSGKAPYCIDLHDTDGTVVVLIDFGLSKLNQAAVPTTEITGVRSLARTLNLELSESTASTGSSPWESLALTSFQELAVDGQLPAGALIFGFGSASVAPTLGDIETPAVTALKPPVEAILEPPAAEKEPTEAPETTKKATTRASTSTTTKVSFPFGPRVNRPARKPLEAGDCPAITSVESWKKAIACGNNGCTELVAAFGKPATLKVAWDASTAVREATVLTAMSKLRETEEGCIFGQRSDGGLPCALTPNVLQVFASSSCEGTKLPSDVIDDMTRVAQRMSKKAPELSAKKAGFTLMEFIHFTLDSYRGMFRKQKFERAVLLQLLFAYHVAFKKIGFIHNDVLADNLALRCETTFKNGACSSPPAGTMVYCFSFESGTAPYCIDLHDTDGTLLVLIDFGQSKLGAGTVPKTEITGVRRLAREFRQELSEDVDDNAPFPWKSLATETFKELAVDGALPDGALIFGY